MESTSRQRKDEQGAPGGDQASEEDKDEMSRDGGAGSDDDEQGTRQPYKCTFCRRGFPTAQALGGHMNVHRKHRGRSSGAAVQGRSHEHQYSSSFMTFAQTHHHPAASSASSETTPSMAIGMDGSIAMSLHAAADDRVAEPKELRLFSTAGGGEGARDVHEDRNRSKDDHGQGEELDLELRLGGGSGS